ncbi:MAG TPA: PaaI family thioesterase [Caldisericia bacterium]|nr:PaaI family thioesterase [Caldisericia bacterium]HPF49216.1 PaaI family thioesterase [Caldisericia bacterium]HPI84104.1 PaaI family thioesterase [Caldisericia bacterium]HPQ93362.1 PaaI family thioesterase [Caldisericia bacterium]HRV75256.1 PaaI family thioesterase [Caldisericia bacterium]
MASKGRGTKSNCFGCGINNKTGLGLKFSMLDGGIAYANLKLSDRFEGMDGLVHGGAISSVLDESMSHAIFRNRMRSSVTADLYVRYVHPVKINESYTVRAWVKNENRKIIETKAQIIDITGTVVAWAEARFMSSVGLTGGHEIERLED